MSGVAQRRPWSEACWERRGSLAEAATGVPPHRQMTTAVGGKSWAAGRLGARRRDPPWDASGLFPGPSSLPGAR